MRPLVLDDFTAAKDAVHKSLEGLAKGGAVDKRLSEILTYRGIRQTASSERQALHFFFSSVIRKLATDDPVAAKILEERFIDGATVLASANRRSISEPGFYVQQRKAIQSLTEIILQTEAQERTVRATRLEQRLPIAATDVVGIEDNLGTLVPLLTQNTVPYLLALVGMGGIGKTTLADAIIRHLFIGGTIADVGWVSAKPANFTWNGIPQELKPALTAEAMIEMLYYQLLGQSEPRAPFVYEVALGKLKEHLKKGNYVVVVDNLETVLDLETLLPLLRQLMNPTKFLLTSRRSLPEELDVYHYTVPELSEHSALTLVRKAAATANVTHIVSATDDDLRPIYDTVGGNPLALRLVVGQSRLLDLDRVLDSLKEAKGKAQEFYGYLYRHAWGLLDEGAREAWLSMPMIPATGGTFADLQTISELDETALDRALQTLTTLNLVDKRPALKGSRYAIHSLTRSFLEGMGGF